MLDQVPLKPKSIDRYAKAVGDEQLERLRALATRLGDARILHVNATAYGGGVAELLATAVPLARGLGLDADWQVMFGADDFFNVTKTVHNALQGMEVAWTDHMEEIYLDRNLANARDFDNDYDFVVMHDPQPAAMLPLMEGIEGRERRGKWVWRCHIDTSNPFPPVADFLFSQVPSYDASVFTMREFVPDSLAGMRVEYIQPCIDPLSLKNVPLTEETVFAILESYDIDPHRPMICQVSRFDPWKDPVGVIDAYRKAKEDVPELQLVLAGSMASDDPEGMHYLHVTEVHAEGDPDIFILTNAQQVGAIEVNAFQLGADIVLQKSLREGFGLTVSEALWKQTPVIGGNVGGIRLQIDSGATGYLVDDVDECADAIRKIYADPSAAEAMGAAAKEHVRENFVMTVLVERWLALFADLAEIADPCAPEVS